jgi:hypothetical protein
MILMKPHRITKAMRVVVECDTAGCEQSFYLSDGVGPETAAAKMATLGWAVADTPGPLDEYLSTCPEHTDQPAVECKHERKHRRLLDRDWLCGLCGRHLGAKADGRNQAGGMRRWPYWGAAS